MRASGDVRRPVLNPQEARSEQKTCCVCGRNFELTFSFQRRQTAGGDRYYCSSNCLLEESSTGPKLVDVETGRVVSSGADAPVQCDQCGKPFKVAYLGQIFVAGNQTRRVCSPECRTKLVKAATANHHLEKIAVLNQKGGTGKTTTSVTLAAGLAASGKRVLLIDMDSQGNVGASLGVRGERSIYHVLIDSAAPQEVAVPVRPGLDIITSDETVAAAEIRLVNMKRRERLLKQRLEALTGYDYVVLDCAPSLSIVNQNALTYANDVLIPVSCDFLAMFGVKQILKTVRYVREQLVHPLEILGVLPTFYDPRARITHDVMASLKDYFKDQMFEPIRANSKLKEAPSYKKTIFEYDPRCPAAVDYQKLVSAVEERLRDRREKPRAQTAGASA